MYDFRGPGRGAFAGDNGSGRWAIFDAITYARSVSTRADDQGTRRWSTRAPAPCGPLFEFSHGGTEYRLTHQIRLGTRPRAGTSTVTRECSMEWLRPDGEWVELPDSLTKNGLEAAVERLGFGFETFTASVLLVQGQGDRLVLAGARSASTSSPASSICATTRGSKAGRASGSGPAKSSSSSFWPPSRRCAGTP